MSHLYRLTSQILGEPAGAWIARERRPDEDIVRPWHKVARNLAEATNGEITVSGSTVNRWSSRYGKGDAS